MPSSWAKASNKENASSYYGDGILVTFGKVKDGETKNVFLRILGDPHTISVVYDADDRKYYEVAPGEPNSVERLWAKVIVYEGGKFIGKIAFITPFLGGKLAAFSETPSGKGFNDIASGKFIVITTHKKQGTKKISYTVKAAVSKKAITVDLNTISFPDIHDVISPKEKQGEGNEKEATNENDLFEVESTGINPTEDKNDDDVPF
jgi:hypothetical protein